VSLEQNERKGLITSSTGSLTTPEIDTIPWATLWRFRLRLVANCCAVLLGLSAPMCSAQVPAALSCHFDPHGPTVRLTGTVADQSQGVIIGANVTLLCGHYRQQTQTTADGSYSRLLAS
jgi:hypothetical protein